jgi:Tfp pilus assembly protein PilO
VTATLRRTYVITALVAIVVIAIWFVAVWRPLGHKLTTDKKAQSSAQSQVVTFDGQLTELNALKKQIPADKATLAVLEAAVPNKPALDGTLDQLNTLATTTGVTLTSVTPGTAQGAADGSLAGSTPASTSGTPSIDLGFNLSGTYAQLMAFLSGLNTMPRTIVVDTLSLSDGSGTTVTANMTVRMFYAGQPTP